MPYCRVQRLPVNVPFCCCKSNLKQYLLCKCGEDLNAHEWAWDSNGITRATVLSQENREVFFHPGLSSGTAAVRGTMACTAGNDYYWEIKMLTPVYGTDVMVGVGTNKVNLTKSEFQFCSLLGSDEESWGYSYNGTLHHNGKFKNYGPPFGKGSIVGVHLNMWRGELTFYNNRKCLGTAFTSLKAHELYPMVSSTAAQSAMRVIYSYSCLSSLQLLCLNALSSNPELLEEMNKVPGLRTHLQKAVWWLTPPKSEEDQEDLSLYDTDEELELEMDLGDILVDRTTLISPNGIRCGRSVSCPPPKRRRTVLITSSDALLVTTGPVPPAASEIESDDQEREEIVHFGAINVEQRQSHSSTDRNSCGRRLCLVCDTIY